MWCLYFFYYAPHKFSHLASDDSARLANIAVRRGVGKDEGLTKPALFVRKEVCKVVDKLR